MRARSEQKKYNAVSERQRDVERKRRTRSASRVVTIPPCAHPTLRAELEQDDCDWLRWYFGDLFWYDFTLQQRAMIAAIRDAIRFGGDQALAASRGEGKTKIFERTLLKHILAGTVSFAVLCAATGPAAQDSLASIKDALETSDKLLADYPEVCVPIRALENTPNRAHYQVVKGKRHDNGKAFAATPSRFVWCGREVTLPRVPGSPSAGAVIATRGLDAAIRGLNKFNRRPDVVGIDDPDTEESVASDEQADKLEKRIDRGIAGLGGQQRSVARVMLTTLQRVRCVSAKFTDPKQKPTWKGRRFRFLLKQPAHPDLWEEYMSQRRSGMEETDSEGNAIDPLGRRAHAYYLANLAPMNEGAEVANSNRFNAELAPDGSQMEVSALERYYNEVARIGQEAVSTEYDNDPPDEAEPEESGITAHRIQKQVSGHARKEIPPGCAMLTMGLDVRKVALHWVVRAWDVDNARRLLKAYTIDYGVTEVYGTEVGTDEGLDNALIRALHARRYAIESEPYCRSDGSVVPVQLTLVDAGWRTEAIYRFCAEAGLAWRPAMGFGKSAGCAQANFNAPATVSDTKKPGDRWFLSRRPNGTWLVCMDSDHWKAWEHDRWMTSPDKPGSMALFGSEPDRMDPHYRPDRLSSDQKGHFSYAKHITAEVEVEEVVKGRLKRYWKSKNDNNHYLDASYMSDVAASMCGLVTLVAPPKQRKPPQDRPSAAQLAAR
jgi:hypothetical protein